MKIDTMAHRLYGAALIRRPSPAICPNCGTTLTTAYHEKKLYSVQCAKCETVTLVKARNPHEAAKIVGYGISKETVTALERMGAQAHGEG